MNRIIDVSVTYNDVAGALAAARPCRGGHGHGGFRALGLQ